MGSTVTLATIFLSFPVNEVGLSGSSRQQPKPCQPLGRQDFERLLRRADDLEMNTKVHEASFTNA
jgi:hypothetical protein